MGELVLGETILGELVLGELFRRDGLGELVLGEMVLGEMVLSETILGELVLGELQLSSWHFNHQKLYRASATCSHICSTKSISSGCFAQARLEVGASGALVCYNLV